ncbi:toxin-antitoxin system HicB family antitoxin [Methylomonas rosea]|uniref:Toxin-antitoxin system HicB family antitoxin n=1 Tax=Methylomonas rosea TaxID=2952227 RepID=A0ABT1TQD4_9GAMM|nr:toxin-antitoxin system HicB family antitoxin [Methylomonas sp. WSC-7]MCQ8116996.1 toxin-antitoxin system HicB family antitoxin [Methylomonas sp. WSC-7]
MKILNLSLPDCVLCYIKELASKKGVSINQFIASAVAEKVSAITTEDYLRALAERADKAAFQAILAKVPKREPLAGDEL